MENNTARNRLDDMLERYGEVCTQKVAAQLLSVVPRTIHRMLEEGRLRRVDRRVDVHISTLRKKLADATGANTHIRTVRGMGYVFIRQDEDA